MKPLFFQNEPAVIYLIKEKGYTIRYNTNGETYQALYGDTWYDFDPIAEANHFIT